MAHIEKRRQKVKHKDGTVTEGKVSWRARHRTPDGETREQSFDRKVDAQAWLNQITASLVTGTYADPKRGRQSFHAFALEWAASQDWKDTTRADFPRVLARAESALPQGATLASIDQLVIKGARGKLSGRYAPATVDLTLTYIGSILRAAYATQRIGIDPTIGSRSRRPRGDEARKVGPEDIPTRVEVGSIWSAAPAPYRAAVALAASGLRIGEVLGLTADRVDVDTRLVTIDRQLQRIDNEMVFVKPKGEKERTIRVPGAVAVELRRHLREHPGDGVLFRGLRTGDSMRRDQFYASAWHPALIGAGLTKDRYKFHSLRHWCASSMLAEGINPMAVAGHIGDTLETLQRVYSHWMRDDLDVPADALDRILRVGESVEVARLG